MQHEVLRDGTGYTNRTASEDMGDHSMSPLIVETTGTLMGRYPHSATMLESVHAQLC